MLGRIAALDNLPNRFNFMSRRLSSGETETKPVTPLECQAPPEDQMIRNEEEKVVARRLRKLREKHDIVFPDCFPKKNRKMDNTPVFSPMWNTAPSDSSGLPWVNTSADSSLNDPSLEEWDLGGNVDESTMYEGWQHLTIEELQRICDLVGLSSAGTRQELMQRIIEGEFQGQYAQVGEGNAEDDNDGLFD